MTRGKLIFTGCVLLLIIILSWVKCGNIKEQKEKEASKQGGGPKVMKAMGYVVHYSPLDDEISVNGSVIAADEVSIQPEVSGRITSLNLKEGSIVSKGTILAKINDADLKAQLVKLSAQLKIAQNNYRRVGELLKINGISQMEYDAVDNQVASLKADMNLLQVQIAKTEIRAPFTGKLGLRNVSLGAFVTPATVLSTLQNISQLKVDISIPERYANLIRVGDKIECHSDGINYPFTAKVIATNPQVDETTRNLKVRALIIDNKANILPGNYVKATIKLQQSPETILIPSNAIIPDDKSTKVVVVDSGKAKFVPLVIGTRTSSDVQVVSGLKVGDTILVSGLLQVKPAMGVTITKVVSNPAKN